MSTLTNYADRRLLEITDEAHRLAKARLDREQLANRPLGLTRREIEAYRLTAGITGACNGKKAGGVEMEASLALEKSLGKSLPETSFLVPLEVLAHLGRRDLNSAVGAQGGFLVGEEIVEVVPTRRAAAKVVKLGATEVGPLTNNALIPRFTAGGTITWHATEQTVGAESTPTLSQIALLPKTVSINFEWSRQWILQSAAEPIVQADVLDGINVVKDQVAAAGSGASGQPVGIVNTAGIGSVTGAAIAWSGILEFEQDVAEANVLHDEATGGYLATPAVRKLLKGREKAAGSGFIWEGHTMNGYPALASTNVPAANLIFGDWRQLLIAMWGVMEFRVNPYANFQAGIVGVQGICSMDIALRTPAAFSVATGVS